MFEKEAKEYEFKIQQEYLDLGKNGAFPPLWERIAELWQKGAEFGYNKANEWHKTSEKLPEEGSLVLAYVLDETEPTICEYATSNQWECLPSKFVFCSNDQVKKWKEILLPKPHF